MTTLCALGMAFVLIGPVRPRRAAERRLTPWGLHRLAPVPPQSAAVPAHVSTDFDGRTAARQVRRLALLTALAVVVACMACFRVLGLLLALGAGPAAFLGIRRLGARTADPQPREIESLPVLLELLATAIRSGAALSTALTCVAAVAPSAPGVALGRTAALLRLGAPPIEAWRSLRDDPQLSALAVVAARSADSGIRLADGLGRQAEAYRADLRAVDAARASKVGVIALLPVGLCFLPAFVCLGIVPIVAGIAGTAFGGLSR